MKLNTFKIIAAMLLMCGVFLPNTSSVSAASVAEDFIYTVDDGGATITQYTGAGGEVTIPDGVTAVCARAFYENSQVQRIVIPSGVFQVLLNKWQ